MVVHVSSSETGAGVVGGFSKSQCGWNAHRSPCPSVWGEVESERALWVGGGGWEWGDMGWGDFCTKSAYSFTTLVFKKKKKDSLCLSPFRHVLGLSTATGLEIAFLFFILKTLLFQYHVKTKYTTKTEKKKKKQGLHTQWSARNAQFYQQLAPQVIGFVLLNNAPLHVGFSRHATNR